MRTAIEVANAMKVSAYYSTKEGELYYHNDNECTSGSLIPLHDLAPGTGGKELCATCSRLNGA